MSDHEYHRHATGEVVPGPAARCIDPSAGAEDVLVLTRAELAERLSESQATRAVEPPAEPGHVAFEVEIVPHDWPNDGMGWHKGHDTPERVAATLRHYADQVESFTPPNPPQPRELSDAEQAAIIKEKYARDVEWTECTCGHYFSDHPCTADCGCER